jgi:hypothetical protein
MTAPAKQPNTQQQIPPGGLFGLPNQTQWFEQFENNDQNTVTLAGTSTTPVNNFLPFKQTDVIFWWELEFTIWSSTTGSNGMIVPGGAGEVLHTYAPYNFVGESRLRIQNMFDTWHVLNGIDAAIFQSYRPVRHQQVNKRTNLGWNPSGDLDSKKGWINNRLPEVNGETNNYATAPGTYSNNVISGGVYHQQLVTSTVTSTQLAVTQITASGGLFINFTLEVPAGLFFDEYYDMTADGSLVSRNREVWVSPQLMAGSTRQVQPAITMAPIATVCGSSVNGTEYGLMVLGQAATSYGTTTAQVGVKRVGCYSSNDPRRLPVIWRWQYVRDTRQLSIASRSIVDLPIPINGQILSVFVRLFDPAGSAGTTNCQGTPIPLYNTPVPPANTADGVYLTLCRLEYGSGLLRFQDRPRAMQRRFVQQHGFLPPVGVVIWDMGVNFAGEVTNALALNTLNTAGINIHLEFNTAVSSSAYAVVGVEALQYVSGN